MKEKRIIKGAQILSAIFTPFYSPMWILVGLFFFSYLKTLPTSYKLFLIVLVYVCTILIPRSGINIFRIMMKWSHWQLSHREHRHLPYIVTLCSYALCLMLMHRFNVVMPIRGIVVAALVSQIICVITNIWWKVSTHMVGVGGMTGALIAFSLLFLYNPVWYLCILLLLSGALGTSRIILHQHNLAQVSIGYLIGFVCSIFFILISWIP